MSPFDALLTYPLTPSELVLLNGEAFAPRAGLGDRLPLLNSDAVVSATELVRAMLAAAFLVNDHAGCLRLEARPRQTPFGPSKLPTLYVESGDAAHPWPAPSLEARLSTLAAQLGSRYGAPEAGAVVHAWLGADTPNPWHQAAALVQRGLADRALLEVADVVQFGFVKTQAYRLPASAASLAAQGPLDSVRELLRACAQGRPEIWRQLSEQIDGGVRQRLKALEAATRRQVEDDE